MFSVFLLAELMLRAAVAAIDKALREGGRQLGSSADVLAFGSWKGKSGWLVVGKLASVDVTASRLQLPSGRAQRPFAANTAHLRPAASLHHDGQDWRSSAQVVFPGRKQRVTANACAGRARCSRLRFRLCRRRRSASDKNDMSTDHDL